MYGELSVSSRNNRLITDLMFEPNVLTGELCIVAYFVVDNYVLYS